MSLGVFGGTFDPPHVAHLIVAQDVYEAFDLEAVLFVPAGIPPHKTDETVSPAEARLAMLRAAVGDDPRFRISGIELRREGPSYTVDTLRELLEEEPDRELRLIIGADQLAEFGSWKEPGAIAGLARVTVMNRGDDDLHPGVEYDTVRVPRIALSSTLVRERVARGRPIRYLVPDGVVEIIEGRGLYRRE